MPCILQLEGKTESSNLTQPDSVSGTTLNMGTSKKKVELSMKIRTIETIEWFIVNSEPCATLRMIELV
ncbi:hypothetical protein KIN20_003059 [Parelaphostrongylus tenuis]|uniref:Uncharacterized protein n=1 Tax=Parelaphostrongylus tenuis TaxID=148309 RepID=A0AAD5QIB6_PARTN|nr:hypothetical protein KIN20_003059 [Parelaphostrongylus tenuis]